ncbi:tocopherol cyclase family protein [Gordonibacter urolithinfaciens]|uniref:Stress response protein nst1 n=1 Tax=Gordonibacter urolithinfaciens TaxID=1335613 RepID=A0A6N8IKE8_9ACTN|nr:tocopherol cyclase family protein [Gordonibacter urolithinfaciens]MVM55703.1 stress response protein nst1 [Gordonibacter urolithinfaciens]MVN16308.1 stress response protein nst1 [Gordonibacter urolithinfaciens]MVN39636.1 stress response protein nst1 [Gordonibacter urolithinfaciens]MVN56707.1 stress response protein nst1 [Gordonibacter urolithinfaciens]MVN61853.1 stress response protein nst1 [Gordonibacter urolithinfaciens]
MRPYYEGWYMKQQQGGDILAVIPGRAQDEAFIQVVTADGAHYLPFPLEDFRQTGTRSMRVGRSLFSPIGMMLDVQAPDLELVGRLRYRELTPLRSDIMGPFAYLPLETKHTVFSMRHRVDGEVELNGRTLRFENAKGYMEGDRGHSFPRGYTWIQSTDFGCAASVMLALAEIPLAGLRFTGCIGVVWIAGVEHRFATYRGVRIREASDRAVEVRQGDMTLRVELPEAGGHRLQAPAQGSMARPIRESPAVPARFRFVKGGRTLLDSSDACTSFELVAP